MKMDMNAVADEHRARNARIVNASRLHMPGISDDEAYCEALALALLELAEMWREDAIRVMEENKRGCKTTADSLRDCATRVSGVAIAIRQHGLPVASPKDDVVAAQPSPVASESSTTPGVAPLATPDKPWEPGIVGPVTVTSGAPNGYLLDDPNPTQTFLATVGNDKATDLYAKLGVPAVGANRIPWTTVDAMASAVPASDTAETETLVEATSSIITQVHDRRAADAIDPNQVKIIKAARLKDISLVTDPLPGFAVAEGVVYVNDKPITVALEIPMTPEMTDNIFSGLTVSTADPAPAWTLQPQVPVMELTDDPATWLDPPTHASVSQVQLMGECGLKYWLRYRRGALERPSWAMVGGSALHACIEQIESDYHGEIASLWKSCFESAIMGTQTANPLWPVETWHASKSGKEDRAWWDSDGPEMVHRYLEWRAKWVAQGWELLRDSLGPIVEREFLTFLGGMPVKGFIDQAWYHPARQLVAIIDAKSGASTPPDYFQPATYAQALKLLSFSGSNLSNLAFGFEASQLLGGYWDARKGELMAPGLVNLEERHPSLEVGFRFAQLKNANDAAVYMPNTNSAYGGCNNCSLKRACPVGSRIGVGTIQDSVS